MVIRAFLACEISDGVKKGLAQWFKVVGQGVQGLRWLSADQWHLTLRFLGEVDESILTTVGERAAAIAASVPPHTVELKGVGVFASLRRPRIVWIGLTGELAPFGELQQSLEAALQGLPIYQEKTTHPFHPHLTIGRIKNPDKVVGLESLLMNHRDRSFGFFEIKELVLFKSELTSHGAHYSLISKFPLGGEALRRQ